MEILIIVLLILVNGVLSMSEIALVSVRKSKLEVDAKKGSKSAATVLRLAEEPNRFLSTGQIGITMIGILTGLYSGEAFAGDLAEVVARISALEPYALLISKVIIVVVVTYFTLIFGELVPKRLGMNSPERVAKYVAAPMIFLSQLAHPFVWLLSKSTSLIMKLFGLDDADNNVVTEDEIKAMLKESMDDGQVQQVEHDIVERVFGLGDRDVSSIMTHRSEVVWLDINDSNDAIRAKVRENLLDVYPVGNARLENIEGVVSLKDMFREQWAEENTFRDLVRPAKFLPETQSVYSALEDFKAAQVKFGIVIDEFGDILGILTLTDIMEALVGEVSDPGEEQGIVRRDDGSVLVDGQYSFYDFLEYFDMEELYADHGFNTVSGLILDELEHIPVVGEKVSWHDFHFEILDMDGARIDKVLVAMKKHKH